MTCRELTDFLSAYVDRELPEDVRLRFDAHVAACPACAAYLRSFGRPGEGDHFGAPQGLARLALG